MQTSQAISTSSPKCLSLFLFSLILSCSLTNSSGREVVEETPVYGRCTGTVSMVDYLEDGKVESRPQKEGLWTCVNTSDNTRSSREYRRGVLHGWSRMTYPSGDYVYMQWEDGNVVYREAMSDGAIVKQRFGNDAAHE